MKLEMTDIRVVRLVNKYSDRIGALAGVEDELTTSDYQGACEALVMGIIQEVDAIKEADAVASNNGGWQIMATIKTVKAMKEWKCQRCDAVIKKGEQYQRCVTESWDAVALSTKEDVEELASTMESSVDDIRSVAEEYRESAQNIEDGFGDMPVAGIE